MHWQTLISILFRIVVLCSTRVLSDVILDKPDLANKLNALVQSPGWRLLSDVKVITDHITCEAVVPMPVILEIVSSNRKPVDEFNVLSRYNEIWTVLMCKYAEIIYKYRFLISHLIRVCKNEKILSTWTDNWFERYYRCFRSLLAKLHGTSPSFKCMSDTLEFVFSLRLQTRPKPGIMVVIQQLAEFTSSIGPTTMSKLTENGINADAVASEMKYIGQYILKVFKNRVYGFTGRYCVFTLQKELLSRLLNSDFQQKKIDQLIPEETTVLQYILDEIDDCVAEILSKWFFDLGFAFDLEGKVTFRENRSTVTAQIPNGSVDKPT